MPAYNSYYNGFGNWLNESWFCIWDDLANPNNEVNLVLNLFNSGTLSATFEKRVIIEIFSGKKA